MGTSHAAKNQRGTNYFQPIAFPDRDIVYARQPRPLAVAASPHRQLAESWAMSWTIKNLAFHDKRVPLTKQRDLGFGKVWCIAQTRIADTAVLDLSRLPDEITYNDLQPRMLCSVCDHRGADVCTAWHVPG